MDIMQCVTCKPIMSECNVCIDYMYLCTLTNKDCINYVSNNLGKFFYLFMKLQIYLKLKV